MILSAALVAALMRDNEVRTCVASSGLAPAAYIARSFELRHVALRSGEQMTVAIATSGCLVSQNSTVRVYRDINGSCRLVFSDNAIPETVEASPDGAISFAAHDTIDTIVEPVYTWNGTSYAFVPGRSQLYDVSLDQRRPYQVRIRFAPGTSSTVLRGTFAENFGQTYVFIAKRGQNATVELLEHGAHAPAIMLGFGDRNVADVDGHRWTGVLPSSGMYSLDVFGVDIPDHRTLLPYAIRLTIR